MSLVIMPVTTEEYIAPDSDLGVMLNYWHGWWRFMWHWHDTSIGVVLPSLQMALAHRKYCDSKYRDKIGFYFSMWRLSICFSCGTIEESRARQREMFPDDIWPTHVLDDVLDATVIG